MKNNGLTQKGKPRTPPARMCVGCGEMKDKLALVRVVKSPEGTIAFDSTAGGKSPGRGAYLCRDLACLQAARKKRRLERAFSGKIPDEVYIALERALAEISEITP